ncbi:MAG: DNA-binding domain-containing protein [Planctomycetota bacterium]
MASAELDRLQRWFLEVVTHPAGVRAGEGAADPGLAIDEVIAPSESLDGERRIGLYAGMYFTRLFEVLEEDFPALTALAGEDARRVFEAYLVRYPSDHPNLNRLGRRLAGFVAEEELGLAHPAFAAELARLERTVQEVFDAPRQTALSTDELLAIPPESWGGLRLTPVAATRVLAFEHPVNEWYQAFRENGEVAGVPAPAPTWLVLYRRDYRVWRLPLSHPQFTLLEALRAGATLGDALGELALVTDLAAIAPSLQEWFRDWSGLGLFGSLAADENAPAAD